MSYWAGFFMAIIIVSGSTYVCMKTERITRSTKEYKKLVFITGALAGTFIMLAIRWFFLALAK